MQLHIPKKYFLPAEHLVIFLFLLMLCLSLYSDSLQNNFLNDEEYLIVKNPYIKDMRLLPRLLKTEVFHFSPYKTNYYRPLVMLSYASDYFFWKLKPVGYHLTSIFLHAMNAFAIFILIRLLFKDMSLALLSGVLFSVHPIYTKVVGLAGNRGYILELLFSLISLIMFLNYLLYGRQVRYAVSIAMFILAVVCRESALFLPFFMVLGSVMLKIDTKRTLVGVASFIILGAAYLALRTTYMPLGKLSLAQPVLAGQLGEYFYFLHRYIRQLIVMPFGLGFFPLYKIMQTVSTVLSVVFYALLLKYIFAKDKKIIFGAAFFLLGTLSIIRLTGNIRYYGLITFEGYIYFASVGCIVIFAGFFKKIHSHFPKAAVLLAGSAIAYYSGVTVTNVGYYRDKESFSKYILYFEKDSIPAHATLGNVYGRKSLFGRAEKEFAAVLEKKPDDWFTYVQLGSLYWKENKPQEAVCFLSRAVALNPRAFAAHNLLGLIFMQQGRDQDAFDNFKKALRINPGSQDALENLLVLLVKENLYEEAMAQGQRLLAMYPQSIPAHLGVGIAALRSGDLGKAEAVLKQALELDPGSFEATKNLSQVYEQTGRLSDAVLMWQGVLKIHPGEENAERKIRQLKDRMER